MKQKKKLSFDIIFTLLLVALLMIMSISHSIVYLYAVLALSIIRIHKPLVIFPVYFVASLSTEWFGLGTGISAGRILSIVMIMSLIIEQVIKGSGYRIKKESRYIVSFIVICFFSCILSVTGSFTPFFLILQSLVILFLFSLRNHIDAHHLYFAIYCSSIIVIIGMLFVIFSIGLAAFSSYRMGQIDEIDTNSNRIAMMAAQIGAVFVADFLRKGFERTGILSFICLLFSIFIIVLSGSRSGLIAIGASFVLVLLLIGGKKAKKYVIPILAITCVTYFFLDWFESLDLYGLNRVSAQELFDSSGEERWKAIKIMWNNVFPQYPIFGVGLGGANFNSVVIQYGMDHPCHNIFFDSLCQLGIIGFAFFLAVVIPIFIKTYRTIRNANKNTDSTLCTLGYALLIAAIFNGIGETVYLEKLFWNAITVCMIGVYMYQSTQLSLSNGKI